MELASVRSKASESALDAASFVHCLDQISDGVTGPKMAAIADRDGVTALHKAAEYGSLFQVKDLDMDILMNTVDLEGRSVIGYALESMNPEKYSSIPGFIPKDLTKSVLFSDSKRLVGACLLQNLLTWNELPKGFVRAEWLDWAEDHRLCDWLDGVMFKGLRSNFMKNVDPILMGKHLSVAKIAVTLQMTSEPQLCGSPKRWRPVKTSRESPQTTEVPEHHAFGKPCSCYEFLIITIVLCCNLVLCAAKLKQELPTKKTKLP